MSEEVMIDPNEELDCYVGMNSNDVQNDLVDKDIDYRIIKEGELSRQTCEVNVNRVNLKVSALDVVTQAYYG